MVRARSLAIRGQAAGSLFGLITAIVVSERPVPARESSPLVPELGSGQKWSPPSARKVTAEMPSSVAIPATPGLQLRLIPIHVRRAHAAESRRLLGVELAHTPPSEGARRCRTELRLTGRPSNWVGTVSSDSSASILPTTPSKSIWGISLSDASKVRVGYAISPSDRLVRRRRASRADDSDLVFIDFHINGAHRGPDRADRRLLCVRVTPPNKCSEGSAKTVAVRQAPHASAINAFDGSQKA